MIQAEAEAAPRRWLSGRTRPQRGAAERRATPAQPESELAHDHDDLRAVQAPIKLRQRDLPESASVTLAAEGDINFRGALGAERDVPVGFREIRPSFVLDTDATAEQRETLLRLTERYCVVLQTLRGPAKLIITQRVPG